MKKLIRKQIIQFLIIKKIVSTNNLYRIIFEIKRIRKILPKKIVFKISIKIIGLCIRIFFLPFTTIFHLYGYRYITAFTDRIGHLALEPDCLLKEQALGKIRKKKWILLSPNHRTANNHLVSYWSNYIIVIRNPIICFFVKSMGFGCLMRTDISHYIRRESNAQKAYTVFAEWDDRPPLLKLSQEDEIWGYEMLLKLGVPKEAWFVCIHSREGGFSPIDEEIHTYRNSNILHYTDAVKEIINRGGWVIRMGDSSMQKLSSINKVIDYAHHQLKSDRLDVFLCAKTRFFLGNTSGIAFLSSVFGVPCALANMIPVAVRGFNSFDIYISKLLCKSDTNKILRLNEVFQNGIANLIYSNQYLFNRLDVIENSNEDIYLLAKEMMDRLEGNFYETMDDIENQKQISLQYQPTDYSFGSLSKMSTLFLRAHNELK